MALRDVSIRTKLALMFGTACLVTFGIGGPLVSNGAADALEDEILLRLHEQSRAYATALDAHLRTLQRRTEDFASDGYVRDHVEALAGSGGPTAARLEAELRAHLVANKLPLERAFSDLSVLSEDGDLVLAARTPPRPEHLAPVAALRGDGPRFSELLPPADSGAPLLAVSVPLTSRSQGRPLGRLVAWIHPGVWIVRALRDETRREDGTTSEALRLIDGAGTRLAVRDELVGPGAPAPDSEPVLSGYGLALVGRHEARAEPAEPAGDVLRRSFPLRTNGWSLEIESDGAAAFATVARLQSRVFALGAVLAVLASALFLFPMRFLTQPLLELARAARRLELGDLETRVRVGGDDEIGELGRSFNSMAEAVEAHARLQERTAEDLRERQRELGFERDRLRAVISSMRDGLIVLDADGRPILHNAAARPILEQMRSPGQPMAPHHRCEDSPDGSACRRCLFDPQLGPRTCQLELHGGVYEIHSTRLPMDADGRSGRVLVSLDLSDRIEQDERQIHQERLAVLGEVAAVMAHELNNPLAAISMYNQMLAADLADQPELLGSTSVIQRNVETCTRAIRELLDYATDTTPEVGSVDLRATLEDVAAFVRPLCDRAGVSLEVALGPEPIVTSGDEVQVRQLVVNLVVNALQALGEGGGHVRVEAAAEDGQAVVRVTDDGPGVPSELREQIFRPFFTTKARGAGTGLGLPTSRRIAEMHGGGLELVESDAGGSVFRARLPLLTGSAP